MTQLLFLDGLAAPRTVTQLERISRVSCQCGEESSDFITSSTQANSSALAAE